MRKLRMIVCSMVLAIVFPHSSEAGPFVAYSMKEAQRRSAAGQANPGIVELGGITDVAGMVYDKKNKDLIIIGQANEGKPKITLDDLVVAMRAGFVHKKTPLVSIERTPETAATRKQVIHWEGGIENTQIGKDMLEADVLLKEIALARVQADVWGVRSYFSMIAEQAREEKEEGHIASRFWFKNFRPSLAVREGVFAIMELDVGVETEVLFAEINGKRVQDLSGTRDEVGDTFAEQVATNLSDLSIEYPVLARARPILALVSIAEGMKQLDVKSQLDFWLYEYKLPPVETPKYYELIEVKEKIEGRNLMLTVSGGIELNPIVVRLKKGYVSALKEAVLNSKPPGNVLIWHPPLEGWHIPGTEDIEMGQSLNSSSGRKGGFSVDRVLSKTGETSPAVGLGLYSSSLPPLRAEIPKFGIYGNLPSQKVAHDVGGVMLDGVAKVGSGGKAQVDLRSGNFSLIVDGKGARIAPEAFRKFVTALWSVYYSNQDPGISIDPIAPGVDKHMVRYIGKVINTDLGRVMREADYLMKKWSVGTERPDMRGFRNPDEISGRRGYVYLAASRFWFIPEDMRFKQANNMLLFDDGRMTVKTEYLLAEQLKTQADPANEQFAQFLTDNYNQLGQKYPVFQELFDYAKMVSLAKYLKQSGVPLFWFLMANKDLVLTEDSPGTVEALAKGSDYFKNLRIEGGVDLGAQGHYVYDSQATEAIREAVSKYGTASQSTTTSSYKVREVLPVGRSFSFDLGGQSYSVAPQHSLTSGKDRRGIRYQTDIALRARGFKLMERSWDALEHDATYREFARQWNHHVDTLSKSELEREGQKLYKQTWKEAEKKVAIDLKQLKSLVGKKYESEDAFTKAVERALGPSSDGHLKALAKKHAYYQTDLEVVRFFNPKGKTQGQFGQGWHLLIPYRIKPSGTAKRDFLNARIPEKMAVENLISGKQEVLTFSTQRYTAAGYVPEKIESSQVVGLFIRTDASYRLVDKLGNEFCFDKAGYLTEMSLSRNHHVKVEYLDSFEDVFEKTPYQIQPAGKEYVQVLNTSVPKVMVARDLLNGSSEEFIFAKEIAAYIPKNGVQSRFEVLNMMTDASFQLHDKLGNVIAFGPDGWFASFAVSPDARMVKSVSAGPYKVDFNYRVGSFGQVHIASAELSEEGKAKPLYAVHYEYDNEGRLCKAESSGAKVAKSHRLAENSVIVAKR